MGVAKAGNDRNTGPQRLIMNIKVSNWARNIIAVLPTVGQWRCLILEEEETLWSGPVKISSAVSMCSQSQSHSVGGWHLQNLVNRDCFVPGSSGQVHLCSKVVPMGWSQPLGSFNMFTMPWAHG